MSRARFRLVAVDAREKAVLLFLALPNKLLYAPASEHDVGVSVRHWHCSILIEGDYIMLHTSLYHHNRDTHAWTPITSDCH